MSHDHSLTGDVTRAVLPNGLTVLVKPLPHASAVALYAHVRAGYFHEDDSVAGLAHLTEHMWFKGSRNWPGEGDLGRAVQAWGGVCNAGTIYDRTSYYFVVPEEAWRDALPLMADAFLDPLFEEDSLRREAEVVIEESHRKRDNATALAYEEMLALAFTRHRIRRWRIGSDEVLRAITRDKMIAFYEALYRPAHLIVSVAGPVDPQEVVDRVAAAFGAMPGGDPRRSGGPAEPPQEEFRFTQRSGDVKRAVVTFGFKTFGIGDPREPALDRFATLLAHGRAARLPRGAVGPGKVASLYACGNHAHEDVGLFAIQAEADDPSHPEAAEQALMDEVHAAIRGPVDPREWERVGNRLRVETLYDLEEVLGLASMMAAWEARGDYREADLYLERLLEVTPRRAQEVAAEVFRPERTTLHRYLPREGEVPAPTAESRRDALFRPPARLDRAFLRDPPPHGARVAGAARTEEPVSLPLPGGATLLHVPDRTLPLLSLSFAFRGGRQEEDPPAGGITELAVRAAKRGTATRNAEEIASDFEYLGTSLGSGCGLEAVQYGFTLPSDRLGSALALLSEVLEGPTFPEAEVERERALQLAELRQVMDSGTALPSRLLRIALYGDHPLARDSEGDPASLASLDRGRLHAWFARMVEPSRCVVASCGDADPEDLRDRIAEVLGRISGRVSVPRSEPPPRLVVRPPRHEEVVDRERKQTAFVVGYPTVPIDHDDRYPLRVLSAATSGLSGRFGEELRARRSLAYTVSTAAHHFTGGGYFSSYLACEAAKEDRARGAMEEQFARLSESGLTDEELDRSKRYLVGSYPLSRQRRASRRDEVLSFFLHDRPLDFSEEYLARIRAVTPEDVLRVCRTWLRPERARFGVMRGRAA